MTITELAAKVARAREEAAQWSAAHKEAYAAWEKQHEALILSKSHAQQVLSDAEKELREAAEIEYRETGNKAPAPGVTVKEVTWLAYKEPDAYAWALEHKVALKLDARTFEKVIQGTPQLPSWVTRTETGKAYIATDLSKFYPGEKSHD